MDTAYPCVRFAAAGGSVMRVWERPGDQRLIGEHSVGQVAVGATRPA